MEGAKERQQAFAMRTRNAKYSAVHLFRAYRKGVCRATEPLPTIRVSSRLYFPACTRFPVALPSCTCFATGEVPDIQIKLKDLLDPLQVSHCDVCMLYPYHGS